MELPYYFSMLLEVEAELLEAQSSSVAALLYVVLVGVPELVASTSASLQVGFELVDSAVAVLVEVDVSSCEYCPNSMF